MIVENKYLRKAIEKVGIVVLVKQYTKGQAGSKLEYISPNAKYFGMNVELLNKGMKLTEDYIFPDDRDKVMNVVREVLETGVDDYASSYRIIGDDGTLRKVTAYVTAEVVDADAGVYNLQLCIQEAAHKTENNGIYFRELQVPQYAKKKFVHSYENKEIIAGTEMKSQMNRLDQIMTMFSEMSELYSVFMDLEGKFLLSPVGPATNMGDFYDLFQTPAYKEYYKIIQKKVLEANVPMIIERQEGGDGRFSAAPVFMGTELIGFWVLGSYTKEETERLKTVNEIHWHLAGIMSNFIYNSIKDGAEAKRAKGVGKKLQEELAKQNIINTALKKINSKLNNELEQVVGETLRDVVANLKIDKAYLYTLNSQGEGFMLRSFFDIAGGVPGEDDMDVLPENTHILLAGMPDGDGFCMADQSNMTEISRENLLRHNFYASVAYPIRLDEQLYGSLIFAESKEARTWTDEELQFMKSVSLIVQSMVENADSDENVRNVNKHLIETYNNFNVGVFVKDSITCEVLFSNKKMNEMLGRDLTGEDSRNILKDLRDRFEKIGGFRSSINEKKTQNWCSYISELDTIMDITEVPIEWLQGQEASLFILRKAKEKQENDDI